MKRRILVVTLELLMLYITSDLHFPFQTFLEFHFGFVEPLDRNFSICHIKYKKHLSIKHISKSHCRQ